MVAAAVELEMVAGRQVVVGALAGHLIGQEQEQEQEHVDDEALW